MIESSGGHLERASQRAVKLVIISWIDGRVWDCILRHLGSMIESRVLLGKMYDLELHVCI
jgi:hypothetical protein